MPRTTQELIADARRHEVGGRLTHAIECWDQVVERLSASPSDAFDTLGLRLERARALRLAGCLEAATTSLAALPDMPGLAHESAALAIAVGDHQGPLPRADLAWVRALLDDARTVEAVEAARAAVDKTPEDTAAVEALAAALDESGDLEQALAAYDRAIELTPSRADLWTRQGEVLRRASRFEEAITAYDQALQVDPAELFALAGRGEALRMLGRPDAAVTWYHRALEVSPKHAFALRGLAATLNGLSRFAEALPIWERAAAVDPTSRFTTVGLERCRSKLSRPDPAAQLTDARQAFERRDYPTALIGYEAVLVGDADQRAALLGRADTLRRLSKFGEAASAYDTLLAVDPKDLQGLTGRGESARLLGDHPTALAYFDRALIVKPGHFLALCGRAACLNALGRFAAAEPVWMAALNEVPGSNFVRRGLTACQVALRKTESPSTAVAVPGPTALQRKADPRSLARSAVERGRQAYKRHAYAEAVDEFQRAVALDPQYHEAWLRLGMAFEDDRRFDDAIRCYRRCLQLEPAHFQAATNIGEALRKAERHDEAVEAYDRALTIRTDYLYALAGRAESLRMLKQHEVSLEWFDRALAVNGEHAFALQGKAAALNALNRYEEALPLWDRAVELEPHSEFAQTNRRACMAAIEAANQPEEESATPVLDEQGRDLTALARAGALGPVVGRDAETRATMKTLIRRLKANPLLLGDPGVGKTAVVEGVAQRLAGDEAPARLAHLRIIELSMGALVAGTKYRGTFEERLKQIVTECKENPEIVLFIDEIHTLVGAGRTEGGSLDAANILKPALARGEIQIIGATTIEEYRKSIEPDSALDRRFQPIRVLEPTAEETLTLLRTVVGAYETHHGVNVESGALDAAVRYSMRFLPNRRLPDKALDLLDEACADASLEGNGQVPASTIAKVLAERTGIPVQDLTAEERGRLHELEAVLTERVIGQDEAVAAVADAVRLARSGLRDPERPRGVFLFAGKTGVGKTELARTLSEALFPEGDALLRLDMSEYTERFTASRLLGVPPGYSGHGEEGQLTGPLRKTPYAVVLLDDFEKAHADVQTLFLSLFDEGSVTDAEGREVDARQAWFVLTSNAGAEVKGRGRLGFGGEDLDSQRAALLDAVHGRFTPELVARIDASVVFDPLSPGARASIAELHLGHLATRALEQSVHLTWSDGVAHQLANGAGSSADLGARGILRRIEHQVARPLSRLLLDRVSGTVRVTVRGAGLSLIPEPPATNAEPEPVR